MLLLTPAELELLTGKTERGQKRYDSQAKVLDALRVPFLRRPDKTLIVYRHLVEPHGKAPEEQIDAPAVLL